MRKLLYVVALLAITYTGLSSYFGYQTRMFYQNLDASWLEPKLVKFEAGMFSSKAYFQIHGAPLNSNNELILYTEIEHGPFPWSDLLDGNFTPRLARVSQESMPATQVLNPSAKNGWWYNLIDNKNEEVFAQLTWLNLDFSRQIKARLAETQTDIPMAISNSRIRAKITANQSIEELTLNIPFLQVITKSGQPLIVQNLQVSYQPLHSQQRLLFIQADELVFAQLRLDHISVSHMLKPAAQGMFDVMIDLLISDLSMAEKGLGTVELNAQLTHFDYTQLEQLLAPNMPNVAVLWEKVQRKNPKVTLTKLRVTNRALQIYSELSAEFHLTDLQRLIGLSLAQFLAEHSQDWQLNLNVARATMVDFASAFPEHFSVAEYDQVIAALSDKALVTQPDKESIQLHISLKNQNFIFDGQTVTADQLLKIVQSFKHQPVTAQ